MRITFSTIHHMRILLFVIKMFSLKVLKMQVFMREIVQYDTIFCKQKTMNYDNPFIFLY